MRWEDRGLGGRTDLTKHIYQWINPVNTKVHFSYLLITGYILLFIFIDEALYLP